MPQNSSQPSSNIVIFNSANRDYYRKKKDNLAFQKQIDVVVKDDALFIKYYGMSAFLELFPDAKGFSMDWHLGVIRELRRLQNEDLRAELCGFQMAVGANFSKKINKEFNKYLKSLR